MIVKRLLRFALGPSFLEIDDEEEEDHSHPDTETTRVRKAHQDNRDRSQQVSEAETDILRYIGLGDSTRGKKLQESHKNISSREAGAIATSPENEIGLDSPWFYIPTSFYFFYFQYHWPVSAVRCRLQTFDVPQGTSYIASFYSFLHPISWNKLYGGLVSSGVHEVTNTIGGIMSDTIPNQVPRYLAQSMIWYISYPLLEWSIKQMIGVAESSSLLPPLEAFINMFSPDYLTHHKDIISSVMALSFLQSRLKQGAFILIRLLVGDMKTDQRILLATHFLMEITSGALTDIFCIPVSTIVYRKVAAAAGAARACTAVHPFSKGNWNLVVKASIVEWLVAWISTQLHNFTLLYIGT